MTPSQNSAQHLKESQYQSFSLFKKIKEVETLSKLFDQASITLIQKASKDTTRKENFKLIPLMNIDTKIIIINWIQKHIGRTICDPMGVILMMQGWFNIHKIINVIQHINRMKDTNYMIIKGCRKDISQNSVSWILSKFDTEAMSLNTSRTINDKS